MRKIVWLRSVKILLVVMTFLVVFLTTFLLNRTYIRNNTEMVNVVVAAQKIKAFSVIEQNRVALAARPRSVVPPGAFFEVERLFSGGSCYAAELGFGEGDILRADRLTTQENSYPGSLARLAENGKMLVAVNSSLVKSCANLVGPGAVVNAIVIVKGKSINDPDRVIGPQEDKRLADLVVVDKKNADAAVGPEQGRDAIPAVITLIINRDDLDTAKALVEYNETGSVYLLPVGFDGDAYLAADREETGG